MIRLTLLCLSCDARYPVRGGDQCRLCLKEAARLARTRKLETNLPGRAETVAAYAEKDAANVKAGTEEPITTRRPKGSR